MNSFEGDCMFFFSFWCLCVVLLLRYRCVVVILLFQLGCCSQIVSPPQIHILYTLMVHLLIDIENQLESK